MLIYMYIRVWVSCKVVGCFWDSLGGLVKDLGGLGSALARPWEGSNLLTELALTVTRRR